MLHESQTGDEMKKTVSLVHTYVQQMNDLTTIIGGKRKRKVCQHLVNAGGVQSKIRLARIAEYHEKVCHRAILTVCILPARYKILTAGVAESDHDSKRGCRA